MEYGNNIETHMLRSDSAVLEPNKGHVDIFFENIAPTRRYRQLGLVEAKGGNDDDEKKILDRLKWLAWKEGADAIIQVKKASQNRETGLLFGDDKKVYDASVYTGVAVVYTDTSATETLTDPVLVQEVPAQLKSESDAVGMELTVSVLLGVLIVILAIAKTN